MFRNPFDNPLLLLVLVLFVLVFFAIVAVTVVVVLRARRRPVQYPAQVPSGTQPPHGAPGQAGGSAPDRGTVPPSGPPA